MTGPDADTRSDISGNSCRETLVRRHRQKWGLAPRFLSRAPGRVNLLGGHVDYSEGWVLPGAIDRAVYAAATPRSDSRVRVLALDLDRSFEFDLEQLRPPLSTDGRSADWRDYFVGVAWVAAEQAPAGQPLTGCDLTISSTLPMGVGVSSSAALTVAQLLVWRALGSSDATVQAPGAAERTQLANHARRFENHYLGVQAGLMDPYASLHGEPGHLLLLDCRSETHQPVPWSDDRTLLLVDSGIERRLSGSGFNDRKAECAEAVDLLRATLPDLRTLRDLQPDQLEAACARLPDRLAKRARHVSTECRRVLRGAEALRHGDWPTFAKQMNASHRSSRDDYETSLPELDLLAETAWRHPGCDGARLSGAGFGGAVLAIVRADHVADLRRRLIDAYGESFDREPGLMEVRIAAGADLEILRDVSS